MALQEPVNPTIFERIGEDGFERLVRGFYAQVPADEILGPMYPEDEWEEAEQRLRDFLVGRFGGPPRYVMQRGHPRLRMRHFRFPIDAAAAERWYQLMERSLDEQAFPEEVDTFLRTFFHDVAHFLVNRR